MKGFASTVVPTLEEKVMAEDRPSKQNREQPLTNGPSTIEEDAQRNLGATTTQSDSRFDDTRKLPMESDALVGEENLAPLAPITTTDDQGRSTIEDFAPPDDIEHLGEKSDSVSPLASSNRSNANELAANKNSITASLQRNLKERVNAYTIPVAETQIDAYGLSDPLTDNFYKDVWLATSVRNTQCFRKVFRSVPDDLVKSWAQYAAFSVSRLVLFPW